MYLLRSIGWVFVLLACSCGSDVVAPAQAAGGTGGVDAGPTEGPECPGSSFAVEEGHACELDPELEECRFSDPDCPGATLVYTCPAEGLWKLEIDWATPNCNSPETCPAEPQHIGGACDVKSFVVCTYSDPSAGCATEQVDMSCAGGTWQLAGRC